ncbi:hypothetical protein D9M71_263320 [compost metagenome]
MIGLHFENLAGHRRAIGEPAFEMMAIGAVGAEGIDVFAIHILGPMNRVMVEGGDQDHFLLECRHALQRRMQHRTIDKCSGQPPGQHSIDHGPGGAGGQVQFDLGVLLVIGGQ